MVTVPLPLPTIVRLGRATKGGVTSAHVRPTRSSSATCFVAAPAPPRKKKTFAPEDRSAPPTPTPLTDAGGALVAPNVDGSGLTQRSQMSSVALPSINV